jgi:hypothetical protein
MCDYSLAGIPSRLAVEGEELIVFHFPTGARGLTSGYDKSRASKSAQFQSLQIEPRHQGIRCTGPATRR